MDAGGDTVNPSTYDYSFTGYKRHDHGHDTSRYGYLSYELRTKWAHGMIL